MSFEKSQYSTWQLTVLVLLRVAIGWHFLYEGVAKLLTPGWSAGHTVWHDNLYCYNPEKTVAHLKTLKQSVIAFKTLAAGAIHPKDGFRFAFENGADFICVGMYDFQMVDNVNIAIEILKETLNRERAWIA